MTDFSSIDRIRTRIKDVNDTPPEVPVNPPEKHFNDDDGMSTSQGSTKMFSDVFGYVPKFGSRDIDFPFPFAKEVCSPIPHHYPDELTLARVALGLSKRKKVLLVGHTGCGKTTLAQYIAAKCGWENFYRINFREDLGSDEVVGRVELVSENGVPVTKGVGTDFTEAVQRPGLILMDEVFAMHPSVSNSIFPLLENEGELRLQHMHGDVIIKRHPDCHIMLADNTHGVGDGVGRYNRNNHDQAFLSRIDMTVKCDYPSKEIETKLVQDWEPSINEGLAAMMVQLGRKMRASWLNNETSLPFTPRTLKTYAEFTGLLKNPKMGFELAFVQSLPDQEEVTHARDVAKIIFGSAYE